MKIHRVKGDGNCLFASCGRYLDLHHSEVRRKVVRALRRNLKINGTLVSDWLPGISLEDYAREMSKDGVYGTGIELSVISLIFRRTINIWEQREDKFKRIVKYNRKFGKTINLLFSGSPQSGHYDVLERS